MPPINRRAFLSHSSLAISSAAVPAWIARAFGQQDPSQLHPDYIHRRKALRKAADRAQSFGKPLLVFVVPETTRPAWPRGELFAALLDRGGNDLLLNLAVCELFCARTTELRSVLNCKPEGEPFMLLVEFYLPGEELSQGESVARLQAVNPGTLRQPSREEGEDWIAFQRRQGREEYRAAGLLADELRLQGLSTAEGLARYAGRARSCLSPQDQESIKMFVSRDSTIHDELVLRAASLLLEAASSTESEDVRRRLRKRVRRAMERKYLSGSVPGSRWAISTGCGISFEDDPYGGSDDFCGMGSVSATSRRFLHFFTR